METACLYFSIVLSQHCTACSGRDSWSPHCELSSQLQQKVWSPENMRVGILATHEMKVNVQWSRSKKSQFLFLIFKGVWDERHKHFYLMGTFSSISDLNMNKLISPHHSQKLKLTQGEKKYNGQKFIGSWQTVLQVINLLGHVQVEENMPS